MSTCNHFLELPDQLCYVQCSHCTTILLVSVPCSSLLKTVTVRCGHCTGLLSVNVMKASFVPLQLLDSLNNDEQKQDLSADSPPKTGDGPNLFMASLDDDEEKIPMTLTVNKPPEKRQRAPSAYNRFIKEEIQRLKAREPSMTHKEAFSTAAKNWAHFPRIHYKGDGGESCSEEIAGKVPTTMDGDVDELVGLWVESGLFGILKRSSPMAPLGSYAFNACIDAPWRWWFLLRLGFVASLGKPSLVVEEFGSNAVLEGYYYRSPFLGRFFRFRISLAIYAMGAALVDA
ncbi:axial regulator YABBY 4-like [Magnolia sinica]|uniref:axial regulator YABBY 4-like n=1 Tax=Magnolia sinica TaxID=86752 RepID=UPI0026583A54|nr:axial regulator YABBY 4-like [Magnolia sinica]